MKGKIICHETKKGMKCKYEGPIYKKPKEQKPKQSTKTYTM